MRVLFLQLFLVAAAAAGESAVVLKEGPGQNETSAQCAMCHSLDYITMNAAALDQAGWEKTVDKMINAMGAPIDAADRKVIIDYLGRHYGK